mmetsp:Transcript_2601/g.7777  ORF Transcript_2601/g.7777 Transcript_2601/m.7777 type:complete len:205 (-) Transcript_2601:592-1206(-)
MYWLACAAAPATIPAISFPCSSLPAVPGCRDSKTVSAMRVAVPIFVVTSAHCCTLSTTLFIPATDPVSTSPEFVRMSVGFLLSDFASTMLLFSAAAATTIWWTTFIAVWAWSALFSMVVLSSWAFTVATLVTFSVVRFSTMLLWIVSARSRVMIYPPVMPLSEVKSALSRSEALNGVSTSWTFPASEVANSTVMPFTERLRKLI